MYPVIRLARDVIASNLTDLKAPYKLTYAITYRCHFRCGMCNIWKRDPGSELSVPEIRRFFQKSGGFSWVNLSGGEIFMRKDLLDIVRVVDHDCPGVYTLNFPTNGYHTDLVVGTVREILSSCTIPRLAVTVSLDGPSEMHDRIRNTPGAWRRAIHTFRDLMTMRSHRFKVYFGMTLQDENADAFDETVRSVRTQIPSIRAEDFHINVLHTSNHYYANAGEGIQDRQRIKASLCRVRQSRRSGGGPVDFLERRYQRMAEDYLETGSRPVSCQALSASLFMDPEGRVYPCTIFDRPLGNVRDVEYDITRLWNTEQRAILRGEILSGNCPHCWTPCEAYPALLANLLPAKRR